MTSTYTPRTLILYIIILLSQLIHVSCHNSRTPFVILLLTMSSSGDGKLLATSTNFRLYTSDSEECCTWFQACAFCYVRPNSAAVATVDSNELEQEAEDLIFFNNNCVNADVWIGAYYGNGVDDWSW